RSARVPCTEGRGNEIFTTFRSAISKRFISWRSTPYSRAISSSFSPLQTRSKTSELPQKTSMVSQKGPAFFERTFCAICPSSTMVCLLSHFMHLQLEGLHRIIQFHHMVQAEFVKRAALHLGGRE